MVQEQVKSQVARSWGKEFAFTKLMTCGLCGSGITAEEKFKNQKDGSVHRHVYYRCSKSKDNCKGGYINEVDLIKQFEKLIEKIDIDEISIKGKLRDEVERFKKFQQVLSSKKDPIIVKTIDIRTYAKYLLREGTDIEKRELLGSLKSRIALNNKELGLLAL